MKFQKNKAIILTHGTAYCSSIAAMYSGAAFGIDYLEYVTEYPFCQEREKVA
jgi:hypothetical protein